MNKVLLLGSTGLLGSAIKQVFLPSDFELLVPDRSELELRSFHQVADYIEDHMPDVIINCAGYNLVDQCEVEEYEQVLAEELNVDLVMQLAKLSKKINAYFITFGSDYVFDGKKGQAYIESDVPNPINYYGQTKLRAEIQALQNNDKALIIRTSWLFGPHKNNFVSSIYKKLESDNPVAVVTDQTGCPTYTLDIANYLLNTVLEEKPSGVMHLCNDNPVNWHQFALAIEELAATGKMIEAISSKDLKRLATRPECSILSSERIKPMRNFKLALQEYITQYL